MALYHTLLAENHEDLADIHAGEPLEDLHGKHAIRHTLRAVQWWPMRASDMPPPEDVGTRPFDEQLWPEDLAELRGMNHGTIECILCGVAIPERLTTEAPGAGMFCERCA